MQNFGEMVNNGRGKLLFSLTTKLGFVWSILVIWPFIVNCKKISLFLLMHQKLQRLIPIFNLSSVLTWHGCWWDHISISSPQTSGQEDQLCSPLLIIFSNQVNWESESCVQTVFSLCIWYNDKPITFMKLSPGVNKSFGSWDICKFEYCRLYSSQSQSHRRVPVIRATVPGFRKIGENICKI